MTSKTKSVGYTTLKPVAVKTPRKTYRCDAQDKILGRLATDISHHLIGKTNVNFQSHVDNGDLVVVSNVGGMKLTGDKLNQKLYYRHSARPGGLKINKLSDLWKKDPSDVLKRAVWRMLPKNKHRTARILRLKFTR